ncbi:AAA family ATPase [Desulfoluna sp.]|uniref:AAA family ATPase n=1 Tax=Desulfoluna sp. TaxID=2045199 RepID=UPI0026287117|nr:AAA family ATPase [Desulfoluna sp.]
MSPYNENIPDPKELEKEIGHFLNQKFGGNVKIVSPFSTPERDKNEDKSVRAEKKSFSLDFHMKPEELVAYLDRFIIRQERAKAVLATKICTHFNRIRHLEQEGRKASGIVGGIKNNVLMIGPTGVGKTYMIKLIADKIGVPFVKGDATKFTEAGYVGGNVEDLIRDLVHEADDHIERAEYGIVYIDEVDKIAASPHAMGSDISRTGVQRALLKPMEETDIELKVPHDPVSMLKEMERYQKTGALEKQVVNTRNILFIMSGAFSGLSEIVEKRNRKKSIGFGASLHDGNNTDSILKELRTEDLVEYGFETEFIGRLPVRTTLETLSEDDLYEILKNPNNPVILSKKLDFSAYGIAIRFSDEILREIARRAHLENTGARGLVSAVEEVLLPFETRLPSLSIREFPVTLEAATDASETLNSLIDPNRKEIWQQHFKRLEEEETAYLSSYIENHWEQLTIEHLLPHTPWRSGLTATLCISRGIATDAAIETIHSHYEEIKKLEVNFFSKFGMHILFDEEAVDFLMEQILTAGATGDEMFTKLTGDFELGLALVREKTEKTHFFITREALLSPERFLEDLIKEALIKKDGAIRLPDNTNT